MLFSETPKKDEFLSNPDKIHYLVHCVECKKALWETKILHRSGNRVVSTETHPVKPNLDSFSSRLKFCPLCKKQFYARGKKGNQLYLIHDLNSKITRLI